MFLALVGEVVMFMFIAGENRTMARGSEISIKFYPYTKEQIEKIID